MNELDERYECQMLNEMYNQRDLEIRARCEANREKYRREQEALNKIKEQVKKNKLQKSIDR